VSRKLPPNTKPARGDSRLEQKRHDKRETGMNTAAGMGGKGRVARVTAVVFCSLLMSACGSMGGEEGLGGMLLSSKEEALPTTDANGQPLSELQKATAYWAREYDKSPVEVKNALGYARNLKALGQKAQAFQVLQNAAQIHTDNKELASEYGRLALELDQITLASQLLAYADDPTRPDWRIISARGAALAKQGKYKDAVLHLEKAQKLAPDQLSVMNNLALAYTMNGEAAKAEDLLRQATARDPNNAKAKQNLALVLGLQGKYDEATQIGSTAVSADVAKANTDIVKQMVKLEPKQSVPAYAPVPAVAPGNALALAPSKISADPAAIASAWSTTVVSDASPVGIPKR
jgi:Flp pilus assembly protein TadD